MRVDQVVPPGRPDRLRAQHPVREVAQLRGQVLLGQAVERTAGHVLDQYPRGHLDARRQVAGRGAGEDLDRDARLGHPAGHLDDVDVHPAGVAGARLVQRGRVDRENGDPAR